MPDKVPAKKLRKRRLRVARWLALRSDRHRPLHPAEKVLLTPSANKHSFIDKKECPFCGKPKNSFTEIATERLIILACTSCSIKLKKGKKAAKYLWLYYKMTVR
jgi:hypothetical protein